MNAKTTLSAYGFALLLASCPGALRAAPGGPEEPVRYVGEAASDTNFHDGALRPVVGVKNYQVMRANHTHPEWSDGKGWTYSHEPMLAYAHGRFYLHWFLSPRHEHEPPSHTVISTSVDGKTWDKPRVLFPVYQVDRRVALMHQRSGFYVAPNGRVLALGFYGPSPGHASGGGIGRVVREIYADNTFGPIYFIRYNTHNNWNEENTWYPLYHRSTDAGFVEACQSLLGNKLHTLSWWEEDKSNDGFYTVRGGYAPSFFHRKDGTTVALWKSAKTALSRDKGLTWSPIVTAKSLVTADGKNWGQKMPDGRYAMVYNPSRTRQRWPLSIVTSEDGILFDDMLTVHGEVPPQRFGGLYKNFGPQYVRGITDGNGTPPDGAMWITYSVNKEDIWVSRIPIPVKKTVEKGVKDTFKSTDELDNWNLYNPIWAPVAIAEGALQFRDKDPYDYAKAVRVFPAGTRVSLGFRVRSAQQSHGRLEIEVVDDKGKPAARVVWADDGRIHASDGADRVVTVDSYTSGAWTPVELEIDAQAGKYRLKSGTRTLLDSAGLMAPVASVERLLVRTGKFRTDPTPETRAWFFRREIKDAPLDSPLLGWAEDLRAADEPEKEAVFDLDDVTITIGKKI